MAGLGLEVWLAIFGAATSLAKAIKFVQEGELGIKLRFGRALRDKNGSPRIIKPGFVLLIPFIETLKRHHVRQQTLRLDKQKVMIARGLIFNVSAIVILRVNDIYRALFEIDDLDNSIIDISMGILRDTLADKNYLELSDMEAISTELLSKLKEKAEEWGVIFIQFKLTDCAPTTETAPLLNVEAGVLMKMEALKTAAVELGVEVYNLPPILAAALVGIPLVTAVTSELHVTNQEKTKKVSFSLFGNTPEEEQEK
ncbi:MAG: SPFH domain-containing protein [bacterium]|nr:SPFH domain-containing protein [bacterium]